MYRMDKILIGSLAALLVVLVIGIGVAIVMAEKGAKEYERQCQAAGGHVVNTNSTGVNPANGQPVIVTNTMCLSSDGRILEV
jgi:hypothetical protein